MAAKYIKLKGHNPYQEQVQGKANEPITVAALLERARSELKIKFNKASLARRHLRQTGQQCTPGGDRQRFGRPSGACYG